MASGTVKSVVGNIIIFSDNTSLEVVDGVTVTMGGKPMKLEDIKTGDRVSASGRPATSIIVTR